jgi:Fe2+ transport system protein FeoA
MPVPLTELRDGETGVITATDLSPENPFCKHKHRRRRHRGHITTERCLKRLTDLGLTPGTTVTVVKSAPFNGPLEVRFRGSRLAIGRGMAHRILVEVKR